VRRNASPRSVVLLVIAGTLVWLAGSGPAAPRNPGRPEAEPDPFANRTVLVEAFVVQMDVSVLGEMGVSPLGREPDVVTAEGLLERLQSGDASVLLAMRTAAPHRTRRSSAGETKTIYRPKSEDVRGGPPRQRGDYVSWRNEQTMDVEPTIVSGSALRLAYSFQYNGILDQEGLPDAPPTTVSWSWSSEASLDAGKPRIVGGTQDKETAIFLILTAHILD
jgi:hypothetical protein